MTQKTTIIFISGAEPRHLQAIEDYIGPNLKKDAEYRKVAVGDDLPAVLSGIDGFVKVFGLGADTLDTLLDAKAILRTQNARVHADYITADVPDANNLRRIVENDIEVYSPRTRDQFAKADAGDARRMKLCLLQSMPGFDLAPEELPRLTMRFNNAESIVVQQGLATFPTTYHPKPPMTEEELKALVAQAPKTNVKSHQQSTPSSY